LDIVQQGSIKKSFPSQMLFLPPHPKKAMLGVPVPLRSERGALEAIGDSLPIPHMGI
jgi:hypothetical protein